MDERKELFSVDECAAIRSRSDGYKDGTDEQFHYMNGYRRACSNDPRAASAEPVAWAITVPNIPKPVAWCPSESYAKSILHEHPGGQIRRLYLDAPAAAPFTQPAASAEPLIRFCPSCGHLGDVSPPHLACCPDHGDARMVPTKFARQCQRLFRDAPAAHKPDGGDVERIRNAGAILDCLTSKLGSDHPLRLEAAEGAKQAVADLYRIADQFDAAIAQQRQGEGE